MGTEFYTGIKMFKSDKKGMGMAFWAKRMAWTNENFRSEMGLVVRRPRPEGQKNGRGQRGGQGGIMQASITRLKSWGPWGAMEGV